MQAEQLLKEGRLAEALDALKEQVRKKPADAKLRVFLFQLQCVLGDWDRALNQLNVVRDMDPSSMLLAAMYGPALQCEALRKEIFEGKRSPVVFGEPEEWMGLAVQACQIEAQGKIDEAAALREKAFDAAPTTSGKLNDKPFEWIADADMRMGPMFEAVINGSLYWVPFQHVHAMVFEKPTDLRDMVWAVATVTWTNGGEAGALMPVRYPGSETSDDNQIKLSRKTEWVEAQGGVQFGLGQRIIATDEGEYPILEVQQIMMDNEIVEDKKSDGPSEQASSVDLTSG